jgi:hypothetical protein
MPDPVDVEARLNPAGGWIVKFPLPTGEVPAKNQTHVRHMARLYAREQRRKVYLCWEGEVGQELME